MRGTFSVGLVVAASANQVGPVQKVVQLLTDLHAKVQKQGDAEEKAYSEFAAWCKDASANTKFEIRTASTQKESLEATIGQSVADAESSQATIEEMARTLAASDSDLKQATSIREKEQSDFKATELELMDAVQTLDRAVNILEREMQKKPGFLQKVDPKNLDAMLHTLDVVVTAASVSLPDKKKLLNLVQAQQAQQSDSDEEDDLVGAPKAAAYSSKSGSIVDILEDLKEKAEAELAEVRKSEINAAHNFNMLKQSLEDQMAADNKDKANAANSKAAAMQTRAQAEGDLALTTKDLNNAQAALQTVGSDCMTAAADHEASIQSRAEELQVIAQAKEIIMSGTAGAKQQTYSFLQSRSVSHHKQGVQSRLRTKVDLVNIELVTMMKRLAKQEHSAALSQLASKINAVVRYGNSVGENPFDKVKKMISDLIAKLESEGSTDANQKAYCDEEMSKTQQKKEELSAGRDKLSAKVDKNTVASTKLKGEVAELQQEITAIHRQQAQMDSARSDENTAYLQAKTDLQQGVRAVQGALTLLRDYYSQGAAADPALLDEGAEPAVVPTVHVAATNAAGGILGMLEVIESDFAKNLAQEEVTEQTAQSKYDKMAQVNKVTLVIKTQDVKYKTAESKNLDSRVTEQTSDLQAIHTQISAVYDYSDKLNSMCVAKPETYEERRGRRQAEIAGLREALSYLEGTGSMLQRNHHSHK